MSRKNFVKSYPMISAGDMSADIESGATSVITSDKASIKITWSGTGVDGSLVVQARNGEDQEWYDLEFADNIVMLDDTGDHQIVLLEMPFTDIRLVYTDNAGTGTLDAVLTMKTVGA